MVAREGQGVGRPSTAFSSSERCSGGPAAGAPGGVTSSASGPPPSIEGHLDQPSVARPASLSSCLAHAVNRLQRSLALAAVALCAFSLARLVLFQAYRADFAGLSMGEIALAFARGLRFDASSIAMLLVLPLGALNLPFRLAARRAWRWFCGCRSHPLRVEGRLA